MDTVTTEDLAQYDNDFDAASGDSLAGDVPDGKYTVMVERAELRKSKTKGTPMLAWQLRIIDGPHAQRAIFKNSMITTNGMDFLKRELKTCGLDLGKLSELPAHLEDLLDLTLAITQRTKGDYTNVYFDELLQGKPAEDYFGDDTPPPVAGQGDDDDLPF